MRYQKERAYRFVFSIILYIYPFLLDAENVHMKHNLLTLVEKSSYLLNKSIDDLSFPLSKLDKKIISDMKYSILPAQLIKANAAWSDAVGMAANQWGINKRIFLFSPYGSDKSIQIIINPTYQPLHDKNNFYHEWEGCFSIPLTVGHVKRFKEINVTYQDARGKLHSKRLKGYPARVWQHETDHLNGLLYDNPKIAICSEKRTFLTRTEAENFYDMMEKQKQLS